MVPEKGQQQEEEHSMMMSPAVQLEALLQQEGCCDSADEAAAIADAAVCDDDPAGLLADYFAPGAVEAILAQLLVLEENNNKRIVSGSSAEAEEEKCSSEEEDSYGEEEGGPTLIDDDDDDELLLQPGDCELCERSQVKLTRHHLIPKSTWSRLEVPLLRCVTNQHAIDPNSVAFSTAWEGLEHVRTLFVDAVEANSNSDKNNNAHKKKKAPSTATTNKSSSSSPRAVLRALLNRQTVDLCRPCHSAVHDAHDNRTLARHYNTLDKLLTCDAVCGFAKWNSTQKTTNTATRRRRSKAKA